MCVCVVGVGGEGEGKLSVPGRQRSLPGAESVGVIVLLVGEGTKPWNNVPTKLEK